MLKIFHFLKKQKKLFFLKKNTTSGTYELKFSTFWPMSRIYTCCAKDKDLPQDTTKADKEQDTQDLSHLKIRYVFLPAPLKS